MKSFWKTAFMAFLLVCLLVAGLPAQQAGPLPPQAKRTFNDPATYVPDVTEKPTSSELRDLVVRYVADKELLNRFYSVQGSNLRREKLGAFFSAWLKELPKIDFDHMSREGQADYILLKNKIEYELLLLERDARIAQAAAPFAPFAEDLAKLQEDRQRLDFIEADDAVAALAAILPKVQAVQAAVESGKLTATPAAAVKTARYIAGMQWALEDWFNFYNGYDPAFTAKVPAGYQALNKALTTYLETVRVKLAGMPAGAGDPGLRRRQRGMDAPPAPQAAPQTMSRPIIADPAGRDGLLEELKGEMIVYTPEQLIEIGNREYAWCEAEMKKAAREMGFGDDWHAALEKVKLNYVPMGKQPELIRNLAVQGEKFIAGRDLVTVPPIVHDTWRMSMKTPRSMMSAPFFSGGESIMLSYPLEGMPEETAMMIMKGNSANLSHATVFHELIPGHWLQGFMSDRYNVHRNAAFGTPFHIEGWALYWEMRTWDLGFNATPEDRIGALFWRMHRAARIVFTMNYQMGFWSPKRCIDFLISNGLEPFTAESEVRGHIENCPPLYQVSYLLGALQFREIYRELVTDGKIMTDKQFNDAYLKTGAMPFEVLRALLENKPLTRDFKASWKFYGDVPDAPVTH